MELGATTTLGGRCTILGAANQGVGGGGDYGIRNCHAIKRLKCGCRVGSPRLKSR